MLVDSSPLTKSDGTSHKEGPAEAPGTVASDRVTSKPNHLAAGISRINPHDLESYVWIPPGEFEMGCSPTDADACSYEDEQPAHVVRFNRGFWIGRTEVTQKAFQKMMGKNPSWATKYDDQPVEQVTWFDAQRYCRLGSGRLPTEAEWEYAARAGSRGNVYRRLDEVAWHMENSGRYNHGVAEKKPNQWGLYDMLGNVWEWAADWYDKQQYQAISAPVIDPRGPQNGKLRVVRGGAFSYHPFDTRFSHRRAFNPADVFSDVGFRCVIEALP